MHRRLTCAAVFVLLAASNAHARATLRQADATVKWIDAAQCTATMALRIETDAPALVDHRAIVYEGARIENVAVHGDGIQVETNHAIGRTQSLTVRLPQAGTFSYAIDYRAIEPAEWLYRCPVWLPVVPADGLSRNVHLAVDLPAGAQPVGAMLPRLTWRASGRGETTLGHLPAIVRIHFTRPGEPVQWSDTIDLVRLVDAAAIIALVAATAGWALGRRS